MSSNDGNDYEDFNSADENSEDEADGFTPEDYEIFKKQEKLNNLKDKPVLSLKPTIPILDQKPSQINNPVFLKNQNIKNILAYSTAIILIGCVTLGIYLWINHMDHIQNYEKNTFLEIPLIHHILYWVALGLLIIGSILFLFTLSKIDG